MAIALGCQTLALMISMRIWPTRYCPTCGGKVIRLRALADGKGGWVGGAGELPVWIGLIAGWLLASVAGQVVGVYVGVTIGVLSFGALSWYALRVEKANLEYGCEACGRSLRWGNWRKSGESRSEG